MESDISEERRAVEADGRMGERRKRMGATRDNNRASGRGRRRREMGIMA